MAFKYKVGPHYKQKLSTQSIMMHLTIGLLVVYAFALFKAFTLGSAYLVNAIVLMVTSVAVALVTESIWALATKKKVVSYLKTSFGWITAIILTLMVPVNTEPYALAVATFIAIFFGKLVFGGFGQNVFNPAAVGRAVIFASFAGSISADLVTTATPTATIAGAGWLMTAENFSTFLNDFGGLGNLFFGTYNGAMGETSTLLILLVGIYLACKEVIDYRVPVTYLTTIFLSALVIGLTNGLGGTAFSYALFHILTGGAVFGAVFMLTDPVTNPNTRAGRMVFAVVAAFFTMLIRLCANLPEGVLYSILLANILTPVIEKVFDGKQTLLEKRNLKIVVSTFVVGVIAISCLGFTLNTDKGYTSIVKPEKPQTGDVTYTDGTFEGTGKGLMGDIKVSVVVKGGKIAEVVVLEHTETAGVSDPAIEQIPAAIVENQTADVDVVSNATFTSNGIIEAVKNALAADSSESEDTPAVEEEVSTGAFTDGEYEGTGKGLMGDIKVNVIVKDGKIAEVVVLEHTETAGVCDPAIEQIPAAIVENQTADVDVVSNATFTSNGIIEAVKNALAADSSESEDTPAVEEEVSTGAFTDGEYEGTGKGLMGDIKVNVIVKDGKIAEVVVLEHTETAGVCDPAIEQIPAAIVEKQSTEVDVVASATFTSNGIMEAAKNALAAAN